MHHCAATYCRLIIAEITLLLIGQTLIGQLAKIRKRAGCIFTATLVDRCISRSRHRSAYPDMSSALEPSGSRRFTSLEESRQALRVRLLAACQNVVIVYTHPRFIPKITVTLITTALVHCLIPSTFSSTQHGSLISLVDLVQKLPVLLLDALSQCRMTL